MHIKQFFTVLLVCALSINILAQSPKREMRSAWVTTVWGLDWPGTKIPVTGSQTSAINLQKNQFVTLINALKSANINTIFFQVRSECDAMYLSSYEPWSAYLLDARRMASDFTVAYDPLQFVIEECHKRGIEVHAWLNPYRFESTAKKYVGHAGDYRLSNPEWVLEYEGGGSILDPGNPGVRQRIADIVTEIVTNYDVDGIVFDDYFYAYGGTPTTLDQYSQNLWNPAGMNLADWRRDNVNRMVADVYNAIQAVKPYVTFGLSPFGIWTTNQVVAESRGLTLPEGITGMDAYSAIYCDPVAWLEQGTVDYVSPQLYWPTTSVGQDYKKLAPWWSNVANKFRRHFYSSHSLSGLESSSYAPPADLKSGRKDTIDLQGLSLIEYYSKPVEANLKAAPTEWGAQIYWNRTSDMNGAPGSVFFRASQFYTTGFINYLKSNEFQYRSLPPAINWKAYNNRSVPSNLRIESEFFRWDSSEDNVRYVVYAIPNNQVGNVGNFTVNNYILGISYEKSFDLAPFSGITGTHTLAVSVLDRYGNEFAPALMGFMPGANQQAELIYPVHEQQVHLPFSFSWNAVAGAEGYILEVANDAAFTSVVYRREVANTSFNGANISLIIGNNYFWRVRTRKVGVDDVVSQTRSFMYVKQPQPLITQPANDAVDVNLTPIIKWSQFTPESKYRVQIASNSNFSGIVHDVSDIEGLQYQVPGGVIFTYATYYLRMMATDNGYSSIWSETVKFATIKVAPNIPVILLPTDGSTVAGTLVEIGYSEESLASGFRVEISTSATFPALGGNKKVTTTGPLNYIAKFENLINGIWYARVRANYGVSSFTSWSPTVSFNVLTTSIANPDFSGYTLFAPGLIKEENAVVTYQLPEGANVKLFLTDISGKTVGILESGFKQQGKHHVDLSNFPLTKGIYVVTLESKFGLKTVKVIK